MKKEIKLVKIEGNIIESLPIHCEKGIKRSESPFKEIVKLSKGTIEIVHKSRYWTGFDLDVLISIFALSKSKGEVRLFSATKEDIADILEIKYDTQMIKESLEELSASILYYDLTFYDIDQKKYIATGGTSLISYHLITKEERMKLNISPWDIRKGSFIAIGDIIWQSLKNGYYKLIDINSYKNLAHGWARKTYLYIEKRLGKDRNKYQENYTNFLTNIFSQETKKREKENFKRTLKALSHLYNFKISNDILTITRKAEMEQAHSLFRIRQSPLTDWEKEILEQSCYLCNRSDEYFRNTISKYIRQLGTTEVYGAIKDTETSQANNKDRYLIHLLKITKE